MRLFEKKRTLIKIFDAWDLVVIAVYTISFGQIIGSNVAFKESLFAPKIDNL